MNRIAAGMTIGVCMMLMIPALQAQVTIEPLKKNGWVGGLLGTFDITNYDRDGSAGSLVSPASVDGFSFIVSSRSGRLVEDDVVFGLDIQWREESRTTVPKSNPTNQEEARKNRLGFIGAWIRYYILLPGSNIALFPDVSLGYASFKSRDDFKDDVQPASSVSQTAGGFGYNAGAGVAFFLSPNVSFDVTARYQGGSLSGDLVVTGGQRSDLTVRLANIDFLFGFQVFLR